MKRHIIFMVAVLFLAGGMLSACEKKATKEEGVYYTCPMHPDVKQDQSGKCPICGMDLVKKEVGSPTH